MANKKIVDLTTRVPATDDWAIFYNEATNKTYKAAVSTFATAGSGSVIGPSGAVDSNIATFDGVTGLLIKDSGVATSSFAPALGADDNYVTDAEKTKLTNLSGTNSGDQTSIVGITGTVAQFNTAITDGDLATGGGTATGTNTGDQTSIVGITGTMAQFDTAVSDGNIVYQSQALGTPASGTLTNCTGLPVNGIVDDTSSALGVGTLELGHASDTTLSRSAAGQIAVEGVQVLTATNTVTETNKRKQPRVYSAANNASLTPEIDTYDIFHLTAMSAATTINNHSTSTPADGELMEIRFLDNGTARALTWDTNYVAKAGVALPTTTTTSKNLVCLFEYNSNLTKWNLLSSGLEA